MIKTEGMTVDDVKKMVADGLGKAVEDIRAEYSRPVTTNLPNKGDVSVSVDTKTGAFSIAPGVEKGLMAAEFFRVVAGAKHNGITPAAMAKKWGSDAVAKSIQAQEAEDGGVLIPEPVMAEVTELLRAAVVVEASGATSVPMPNGNLSMNYQSTASTGFYVGECKVIPPSSPKFGRMKLSAKKLAALVPICNDFLRYSSPGANEIIRNDLLQTLSLRKDLAFIRDDGTQDTPKGLRWLADAGNIRDRSLDAGNVTLETVVNDLVFLGSALENANVRMIRPGFLMHSRVKWFLMGLLDGNGQFVFRDELRAGMLMGYPIRISNQIPTNLGGGGDESEIYFVDFASIIIGDALSMNISVSDVASYLDGSDQVNGFQSDDTIVRALMAHDINARQRGKEIAVLTAVDWLAA